MLLPLPQFVQLITGAVSSTNTATAVINPKTGSLLVAAISTATAVNTVTITDSKLQTWTRIGSPQKANNAVTPTLEIWYAFNVASGSTTITATESASGTSQKEIKVHEVRNIGTVNPLDVSKFSFGTSAAPTTTASTATANPFEYVFAAEVDAGAGTSVTVGAGYSNLSSDNSGLTASTFSVESKVAQQAGAQTATFAYDNSLAYAIGLATFKMIGTDASAVVVPSVAGWKQPVNQFLRSRTLKRQQPIEIEPTYPPLPSAPPRMSYWVHQVNQPLKYRVKRQQPPSARAVPPGLPSAAPRLSYWKQPVSQPVRNRKRQQQPIYNGQEPFYSISSTPASTPSNNPSFWKQLVNQPLRKPSRRQQPQQPVQNPFYGIPTGVTVPSVASWLMNFVATPKGRKRQQVSRVQPLPPLGSQAPYVSYWKQSVNQPLRGALRKRAQPGPVRVTMPPGSYATPQVSSYIHVNQPLKPKQKRQQPAPVRVTMPPGSYATPALTSWLQPKSQPVRRIRRAQQEPRKQNAFYSLLTSVVPILSSWIHPVNQPQRYRVKRQQPDKPKPNAFYSIVIQIAPILSSWIHPVNQPYRAERRRARQQPVPPSRSAFLTSILSFASTIRTILLSIFKQPDVAITVVQPATAVTVTQAQSSITVTANSGALGVSSGTGIALTVVQQTTAITVTQPATDMTIVG